MPSEFSDTNVVNAVQNNVVNAVQNIEKYANLNALLKNWHYLLLICGERPNQHATQNTALSFSKI